MENNLKINRVVVLPTCVPRTCSAQRGQKRAVDPLGLELQKFIRVLLVLGIEHGSSARAASAF